MSEEREYQKAIQDIKEMVIEIKGSVNTLVSTTDLKVEALKGELKVANNRIKDLESNQKWFVCAIIGGFITLLYSLFK